MPSLVAYRKVIDAIYTHDLRVKNSQEIATLADGRTIVVVDDLNDIGEQSEHIVDSIEALPHPLPDELREEIVKVSPQIAHINRRVVEKIREKYSIDDEIKFLRLAPSSETSEWNNYVEACREWGNEERAKLGL